MDIGIVGVGIVGGAVKYGMEKLGHRVFVHDTKLDTRIATVMDTEVCFVCVPTQSGVDGQCDTTIVESVIQDMMRGGYPGLVAIKSTVTPGTTRRLQKEYETHRICFVPEFLRERCAVADFIENHDICVMGCETAIQVELLKKAHGTLPKQFVKLDPTEAELVKYFNNLYNATLVTFANSFAAVCRVLRVDYTKIKNVAVLRDHITDIYLDCNEHFRGFAGACLPKDTAAIHFLAKKLTNVEFFGQLLSENAKHQSTVFEGMRAA